MPAGPIGSVWGAGTWADTTWGIGTWGAASTPPPPPISTGGGVGPRLFPSVPIVGLRVFGALPLPRLSAHLSLVDVVAPAIQVALPAPTFAVAMGVIPLVGGDMSGSVLWLEANADVQILQRRRRSSDAVD